MSVENFQEEGKDQGGGEEDAQSSGGAQPAASSSSIKAYGQGPQTQWGQKGQGVGATKGGQGQRKEQERPPLSPRNPRTCEGRLGIRGGLSTAARLRRRAPAKPQPDLRATLNQVVNRERFALGTLMPSQATLFKLLQPIQDG